MILRQALVPEKDMRKKLFWLIAIATSIRLLLASQLELANKSRIDVEIAINQKSFFRISFSETKAWRKIME